MDMCRLIWACTGATLVDSGFLGKYFHRRAYYDIEIKAEMDNPDQRLSEDIRNFTRVTLAFLLIILGSLMDLVSLQGFSGPNRSS